MNFFTYSIVFSPLDVWKLFFLRCLFLLEKSSLKVLRNSICKEKFYIKVNEGWKVFKFSLYALWNEFVVWITILFYSVILFKLFYLNKWLYILCICIEIVKLKEISERKNCFIWMKNSFFLSYSYVF